MSNEIQTVEASPVSDQLTIGDVKAQVQLIQQVMRELMHNEEHYGIIPGAKKPSLYKAGAEKLCLTFRLDPQYESYESYEGEHLTVKSKCIIYHAPSGRRLGSGEGMCTTRESKYAYREAKKKCPKCGNETIIKGKEEYGGGWICFEKRGGCGAKYQPSDPAIISQKTSRVPNEDIPDTYNTVLKISNKRSLVAAVLNVTAASDIFTQDLEDMSSEQKSSVTSETVKTETKKTDAANTPSHPASPVPASTTTAKKALSADELKAIQDQMKKLGTLGPEILGAFKARNWMQKQAAAWCESKGWDVQAIRHELALDVEETGTSSEDIPFGKDR